MSEAMDALVGWMRTNAENLAGPKRHRSEEEEEEEPTGLFHIPPPLVRLIVLEWLEDPEPSPRLLSTVSKSLGRVVEEELRAVAPDVEAAIDSIRRKEETLRLFLSPLFKVPGAMGSEAFEAFWELEDKWFRAAKATVPADERDLKFEARRLTGKKRKMYRDYRRTFLTWNVRVSKSDPTVKEEDERERLMWGGMKITPLGDPLMFFVDRSVPESERRTRSAGVETLSSLHIAHRELRFAPMRRGSVGISDIGGPDFVPIETAEFMVGDRDRRRAEIEDGEQRTLGLYLGPTLSVLYYIDATSGNDFGREALPCIDEYNIDKRELIFGIPIAKVLNAASPGIDLPFHRPIRPSGKRTDLLPLNGPPGTKPTTRSMKNALALVRIVSVERVPGVAGPTRTARIQIAVHGAFSRIRKVVESPWDYDPAVAWAADVADHHDEDRPPKDQGGHILLPLPLFLAALHQEDPLDAPRSLHDNSALLLLPDQSEGMLLPEFVWNVAELDRARMARAWRIYRMDWPKLHVLYFPRGEAYHRRLAPADAIYFPKYVDYDALKDAGLIFQSSVQ